MCVRASSIPARKVKHATTPSTPTIAPTSAERTGTARRPRPGSTASRDPITNAGDHPNCAAQRPAVDGSAYARLAASHAPPRGRAPRSRPPRARSRARADREHRPVGVRPEVEVVLTRGADREARRQRDRHDHRRHRAHARGHDRRRDHRPDRDPTVGADRAPRREVGRARGDRPHQRLPHEHTTTEQRGQREQQ